jgi:hypothetical protein
MSSEVAEPILLAVVIFVLSQVIQRLMLEPWSEQRKVIGEIAGALTRTLSGYLRYAAERFAGIGIREYLLREDRRWLGRGGFHTCALMTDGAVRC